MNNVIVLILIAALAGGSIAPVAKIALEVFQPFTLVFIRFLATSLILLPFVYKSHELNLKAFRVLFRVALIGAFNPILAFIALQFTPSSVSPLIYASVPLMTAVYLQQVKHIKITTDKILGIVVGFTGVALVILLPFFQKGSLDISGFWGNILILGASVAFMFYGILSKEKQQQLNISPLALTFYFSLVTLILSIPFALYEVSLRPLQSLAIQPQHIFSSLEIGFVGTSLFYITYQKAIQLENEMTASLFTYLQPIVTIILAVLLLGEEITVPFVIGGTLAVLGARMASMKSSPPLAPQIDAQP